MRNKKLEFSITTFLEWKNKTLYNQLTYKALKTEGRGAARVRCCKKPADFTSMKMKPILQHLACCFVSTKVSSSTNVHLKFQVARLPWYRLSGFLSEECWESSTGHLNSTNIRDKYPLPCDGQCSREAGLPCYPLLSSGAWRNIVCPLYSYFVPHCCFHIGFYLTACASAKTISLAAIASAAAVWANWLTP